MFRCTVVIAFASMIILASGAPFAIILLFGSAYAAVTVPFLIMLPGLELFGGCRVLGAYLWVRKKPAYTMANNWISLIAVIAMGLPLINLLGMPGAALSYSLGYTLLFALTVLAFRRESQTPLNELIPKRSDFAILANILTSFVASRFRPHQGGVGVDNESSLAYTAYL